MSSTQALTPSERNVMLQIERNCVQGMTATFDPGDVSALAARGLLAFNNGQWALTKIGRISVNRSVAKDWTSFMSV